MIPEAESGAPARNPRQVAREWRLPQVGPSASERDAEIAKLAALLGEP